MSIYIFSRPVQSGKTTELLNWSNQQEKIAGILMPDMNGVRKIFDIETQQIFDAECMDPLTTKEPITTIGRFYFYTAAFDKANLILQQALHKQPDWLLIDEAGKLELTGGGFYSAVSLAVKLYSNKKTQGNLLITVRDSLCEAIISSFNINSCKVINSLHSIR
jgi:nucleoside-triphosphatase THEP1